MADFSTRPPVRVLSHDDIKQMLAAHRLYLETEWRQGHRANFALADLSGQSSTARTFPTPICAAPKGSRRLS